MSIMTCAYCGDQIDTDEMEMRQSDGEDICENCYEEAQEESESQE